MLEDHFAWFVIDVVAQFDVAAFYAAYRADGHGRAAHDPAMMVALLLYAYAIGERSSRRIERRCVEDVAARVICAEADAVDREEDERFGERCGDELPGPLATGEGRAGWLADAKRRLERRRADEGRPIPASRGQRLRDAKRRLEEELQAECRANEAYEAYRARVRNGGAGAPRPKPYTPPATPQGKINTTDPDSRNVKAPRGWV